MDSVSLIAITLALVVVPAWAWHSFKANERTRYRATAWRVIDEIDRAVRTGEIEASDAARQVRSGAQASVELASVLTYLRLRMVMKLTRRKFGEHTHPTWDELTRELRPEDASFLRVRDDELADAAIRFLQRGSLLGPVLHVWTTCRFGARHRRPSRGEIGHRAPVESFELVLLDGVSREDLVSVGRPWRERRVHASGV
jgi:hypothetical protein